MRTVSTRTGAPGGTLQTMIGEMAIATEQEKGNDPEEQSRQSRESQVFANPYIPLTLLSPLSIT